MTEICPECGAEEQHWKASAVNLRHAIIEECARVADSMPYHEAVSFDLASGKPIMHIAAAIRALKDKP